MYSNKNTHIFLYFILQKQVIYWLWLLVSALGAVVWFT